MEMIFILIRWAIAIPLGLLFLLCFLGNWMGLIALVIGAVKSTSLIFPFVAPLPGLVFFLTVPLEGVSRFWWVAFLEPTWFIGLLYLLGWAVRRGK